MFRGFCVNFLIALLFIVSTSASAQEVPSVQRIFDALTGHNEKSHHQGCESCSEKSTVSVFGACQKDKLATCNGVECASLHCQRLNQFEDHGSQLVYKNCKTQKQDECLKSGSNVSTCNKLYCQFYSKTPSKFFNIAHCPNQAEVSACQKNGGGSSCIRNKCIFYSLSEYKDLMRTTGDAANGSFNILNMPYFTQYNNALNPGATCQNTSIAMVLNYLRPKNKIKPDDVTNRFGNKLGQDPEGVVHILSKYGVKATSTRSAGLDTLKKQLSMGRPVIINGYFTKGGHVLLVTGYDKEKDEFIVNDPAGKWAGHYGGGYPNPGVNGHQARYKTSAFKSAVMPDGKIWMAVVSNNGEEVNL
jgi:uncharacterized protein YvpB